MLRLSNIRIYSDGSVQVDAPAPTYVARYGIIRLPVVTSTQMAFDPATNAAMDHPLGTNKGHTMIVPLAWYNYFKLLQSPAAHNWIFKPYCMMTNLPHWLDGVTGGTEATDPIRFECLILPCNFFEMVSETDTHVQIRARTTQSATARALNPAINNWFHEPHLFWKAQMRNVAGDLRNVGNELDAYTAVMKQQPELWTHKKDVEMFPPLPFTLAQGTVTSYRLEGASVYGRTDAGEIPLRLVRRPGEWIQNPNWKLTTKPVVPAL
ncbi:MAG: hypothetical protein NTW69_06220 [Chloroflexi bacterium]|nr:hypothetical protein [Chloroflexota bacterium]